MTYELAERTRRWVGKVTLVSKPFAGYGGGEALAKGLNFLHMLLLPFLFPQVEYGKISLLVAFEALAFGLISGGGSPAVMRLYSRFLSYRSVVLAPIFRGWLRHSVPMTVIVVFLGFILERYIVREPHTFVEFAVFCIYVFCTAFRENIFSVLRVERSLHDYFFLKFASAASRLGLVAFFSWFSPTSSSFILASAVSIVVVWILAKGVLKNIWSFRYSRREVVSRAVTAIGRPLLFSSLVGVVNLFLDRFMIEWLVGTEAVALYSFAATIAGSSFLILNVASLVYVPHLYTYRKYSSEARHYLSRVTIFSVGAVVVVSLFLYLVYWLVVLNYLREYITGGSLIVVLLLRGCVVPVSLHFRYRAIVMGETLRLFKPSIIACAFNLVFNIILIPHLGLVGAAVATTVGEVAFVVSNIATSKIESDRS